MSTVTVFSGPAVSAHCWSRKDTVTGSNAQYLRYFSCVIPSLANATDHSIKFFDLESDDILIDILRCWNHGPLIGRKFGVIYTVTLHYCCVIYLLDNVTATILTCSSSLTSIRLSRTTAFAVYPFPSLCADCFMLHQSHTTSLCHCFFRHLLSDRLCADPCFPPSTTPYFRSSSRSLMAAPKHLGTDLRLFRRCNRDHRHPTQSVPHQ